MKNHKIVTKLLGVFASFVFTISVMTVSTACFAIFNQPKVPDMLKEYRKKA